MPSTDLLFSSSTHRKYNVRFYDDVIRTTVTHVDSVVDQWIEKTRRIHSQQGFGRFIVGLDIEWRPNFNRYSPRNRVAVLQLCVDRRCLIFQLIHADEEIPQSLIDFFGDAILFVGVGIHDDAEKLEEDYGLTVYNSVNLQDEAAYKYGNEYRSIGLKNLARMVLRIELPKPRHITMSDWSINCLSAAQVEYACLDAFVSFEIGRFFIG